MTTVSIILVSHSYKLAIGVKELADQMADEEVQIDVVAGLIDDRSGERILGTDAVQIATAIERCWTPAGVLILVDLGSAVMSAELALEMIPAAMQENCMISNAPLVEGAVVAALEASLHHSLAVVNQAAENACSVAKLVRVER